MLRRFFTAHWLVVIAFACAACGGMGRAAAADTEAAALDEARLKVALIYNFSQFIEWPSSAFGAPDAPFQICVLGADPFGASLLAVQKRQHQGRPIQVTHPATVEEARHCHVLYIDNPRATPLGRDLAKALGEASVLTVSSAAGSADEGIAIGFVRQADKIRWTMNLNAVRRAQLKVSAKLIEIAVNVVGERGK